MEDVSVFGVNANELYSYLNRISTYDKATYAHSIRVANLSLKIARKLSLGRELCDKVYVAGLLHDYGKVKVPKSILLVPRPLTDFEKFCVSLHVKVSVDEISKFCSDPDVLDAIRCHHERLNGSGYPYGVSSMSVLAKILCVSDVFDALTNKRCYKTDFGLDRSFELIKESSGTLFSEEVVNALSEVLKESDGTSHSCFSDVFPQ